MNAVPYESSQASDFLRANLLQLLRERGVSKVQFCRDAGISRTLLYHFLDGKGDVTVSTVAKIASFFELPLGDLLDGSLQDAPEKVS